MSARILLFLLAGISAAAPRQAAKPVAESLAPPAELKAKKQEILALLDEGHSITSEITQFPSLETIKDWDGFRERRTELRARLNALLVKLHDASGEFGTLKNAWTMQSLSFGAAQLAGGKALPPDIGEQINEFGENDRLQTRVSNFIQDAAVVLKNDEATFASFVQTKSAQRRQTIIVSTGAGVLCLGGLALAGWYSRRMRRLEDQLTTRQAVLVPGESRPAARQSEPLVGGARRAGALPAPSLPEALAPGTVVGEHFRIEGELGQGGMGIVYEAVDVALGRKVAIKRMRKELCQDAHELEQFMKEARLVAALKHPNIVEIHHVLREGDQLLLIFERVPGEPLNRILSRIRRTDLRSAKPVLTQIAAALDHAHRARVVHRDLKPSNIMRTPQGLVKVMDFGIAHQAKLTLAKLTRTAGWGTPPYMAPEQELGQVCAASDVFALGVVCYEMLVGRLPFQGPNFIEQKKGRLYVPPSRVGLPPALDTLLAKALDPQPQARYASAGEFAAALSALAG